MSEYRILEKRKGKSVWYIIQKKLIWNIWYRIPYSDYYSLYINDYKKVKKYLDEILEYNKQKRSKTNTRVVHKVKTK